MTRLAKLTLVWALLSGAALMPAVTQAQNVANGRIAYTTPIVAGQLSCSAGACHTISPANNQNNILKAADDPGAIGVAVNTKTQMAFLKGRLTTTQYIDLAAYIGNPGAAAGAPAITLASTALSFSSVVVGSSSSAQLLNISNTGTADLIISQATSSLPDFSISGNCATIAAGSNCNLTVSFTPAQVGSRSGNITLAHNAPGSSSVVSVFGTGTVQPTPRISVPLSLSFGSIATDQLSDNVVVNVLSVGTAPLVVTGLSINNARFQIASKTCVIDAPIVVNSSCTLTLRFAPNTVGTQTGSLSIQHNASPVATIISLSGNAIAPPPAQTKTMIEYWYTPLNYYFITSRDDEKQALDNIAAFRRTGARFTVLAAQADGANPLVRYFFDKVAVQGSRGSHFYTLLNSEKAALDALNPNRLPLPRLPFNEGVDSWAYPPLVAGDGGSCAAGLVPVYRLFRGNLKFPDDPNHRYVINPATYREFVALGWSGEGVQMCLPPQ
jgi:hypothetical protein